MNDDKRGVELKRQRVGFLTSAFIPQEHHSSAFDFFAIMTAEVVGCFQDKYDIVIKVPKVAGGRNVAQEQSQLLSGFLENRDLYDALILSPYDAKSIIKTLDLYQGVKIPIFTIDQTLNLAKPSTNGVPTRSSKPKAEKWSIEPHHFEGGKLAADSLNKYYRSAPQLEGRPIFYVVQGSGSSPMRVQGFSDRIKQLIPTCEVRCSDAGEYSRDHGYNETKLLLERLFVSNEIERLIGIFACSDELALGVCDELDAYLSEHVENAQFEPYFRLAVVGFDGLNDVTRLIDNRSTRWLINTIVVPVQDIARELRSSIDRYFTNQSSFLERYEKASCHLYKKTVEQLTHADLKLRREAYIRQIFPRAPVVLVITMKDEETDAVNKYLNLHRARPFMRRNRTYYIAEFHDCAKELFYVAGVSTFAQGPLKAMAAARDAIEDLRPSLIALVGICGAVPAEEFTLGDVAACSSYRDYSIGAWIDVDEKTINGGRASQSTTAVREIAGGGGQIAPEVLDLLNAFRDNVIPINWKGFAEKQPPVEFEKNQLYYGLKKYKEKTQKCLRTRFGSNGRIKRKPRFSARPTIVSGDVIKSSKIVTQWRQHARQVATVEMEINGVDEAARRSGHSYPVLAIRGISDVVGFRRDERWTEYACKSAAYAFYQILINGREPFRKLLMKVPE